MDNKQLSYEEFFNKAIISLRDISKSYGIHAVWSGFNDAFRRYYNDDPIQVMKALASQGKIEIRPAKRGVMIYLPGEAPKSRATLGTEALSKILQDEKTHSESIFEKVIDELIPNQTDEN
jgi:hypothetical protein